MNRVDTIESLERRILFVTFAFAHPISYPTGKNPSAVVTADLNHDGNTDVITSDFSAATVSVLLGNGNGTLRPAVAFPVGALPERLAIGDLIGNGIPDIVTANEGDNTVSVLIGNGDGTFAPQVSYPVGVRPEGIVLTDLNGDGRLDIVTADEGSNTVTVLLNAGNGTFIPGGAYFAGVAPVALAVGDLNQDGHPDIVTANTFTNSIRVLLNSGVGSLDTPVVYASGIAPRSIAIADLNSDGRPDVVAVNSNGTSISFFAGLGNGTLKGVEYAGAGNRPMSISIADMNGDGQPDLIVTNLIDNRVGIYRRKNLSGFDPIKTFPAGNGPVDAIGANLVTGDNRPDIVVADFNSNTISVLLTQSIFQAPPVPTTIALSTGQPVVADNNRLILSAQVTPGASSKFIPDGVVQFFDGTTVVGVARVNRLGRAVVTVRNLAAGTHDYTAHYSGESNFAESTSNSIAELSIPVALATPFVQPVLNAIRLPANYPPGARGVANISILNSGTGPATGVVAVELFASTSSTFDGSAFSLAVQGNGQVKIKLFGDQSRTAAIPFHMPNPLAAGNYTFFAVLVPVSGLNAAQVSTIPATALTTQQAVAAK